MSDANIRATLMAVFVEVMNMTRKDKSLQIKEHTASYSEPEPGDILGMEYDRYEIIEGIRYDLKPAPTVNHQKISGAVYISLYQTCHAAGTILYSPIDVYLDEDNQFQPDLVFIVNENEEIITENA